MAINLPWRAPCRAAGRRLEWSRQRGFGTDRRNHDSGDRHVEDDIIYLVLAQLVGVAGTMMQDACSLSEVKSVPPGGRSFQLSMLSLSPSRLACCLAPRYHQGRRPSAVALAGRSAKAASVSKVLGLPGRRCRVAWVTRCWQRGGFSGHGWRSAVCCRGARSCRGAVSRDHLVADTPACAGSDLGAARPPGAWAMTFQQALVRCWN